MGSSISSQSLRVLLERKVAEGAVPGGVLAVGDAGQEQLVLPFGKTHTLPPGAPPVRADTIYDVASLTKPVATVASLMRLVADGRVDLETNVGDLLDLPPASARITVAQLAGHSSGFPAHIKFYEQLRAGQRAGQPTARAALVRMAATTPLERAPGTETVYSDLGYILLGALLERVSGQRLDALAAALVTGPLGMTSTRFVDLDATPRFRFPEGAVAPTEPCPDRGLLIGEVHDENAHAAGGICGHAGLFSTAGDLSRFAAAMCRAALGDAGTPFSPAVVQRFFHTPGAPGSSWRLGWDTPSPPPTLSHAGDLWPRTGVGHLGFTGTSLWLDPPRQRWVVLLTNRVHLSRDREGARALRREVMDAVVREFDSD